MIYSYHNKHNLDIYKEDPKTSTVIEGLLSLPDELLWDVIYHAVSNRANLIKEVGRLEKYEFWPSWDPEGTSNTQRVEPDVFLRFENIDVIIEAKRFNDGGQYQDEWRNELRAYHNEYAGRKNPILLALGGNTSSQSECMKIEEWGRHYIYKCSWIELLGSLLRCKAKLDEDRDAHLIRHIDILKLGFAMHGFNYFKWIDTIQYSTIQESSFDEIRGFFPSNRMYFASLQIPLVEISDNSINQIKLMSYGEKFAK